MLSGSRTLCLIPFSLLSLINLNHQLGIEFWSCFSVVGPGFIPPNFTLPWSYAKALFMGYMRRYGIGLLVINTKGK
ncbi:hypothetical protein CIPAW_01G080000 [Carya illinoinensis]|uniref:Uncharacterized protein n=1 Tax=Carya illinoinensis TaxID=32201 RepID=A0A8T1RMP3_CARIL|nr:hypothetical protein CIPAW_01G080000 [Carya illinoinensis]